MNRCRSCRAFTLIEMMVVVFIVSLTATFLIPKLWETQLSAKQKGYEDRLVALVKAARQTAEQKRIPTKLKIAGNAFEVVTTDEKDTETVVFTEAMPDGMTVGGLRLKDQDSTETDWAMRAYSDGRVDQSAVELTVSGRRRTLQIDADGGTKWGEGAASDQTSPTVWEAGDLEKRSG